MKAYQMIYTYVKNSLSDSELGLANQEGLRVYSCTQGLTKENIEELVRFSSYKMPRNGKDYITGEGDAADMLPKAFRTLRLSDGKYAAIQSVFAGLRDDEEDSIVNFFAHALVFDDVDGDFFPEQYFGSKTFRTALTEEEQNCQLVHYLPAPDAEKSKTLERDVLDFIGLHKKEMSYLINRVINMMTSGDISNICVSTDSEKRTNMFLLALKWLLPRDVSEEAGISTYNIYLPSDRQRKITIHGTVNGLNNITPQSIENRTSCIYIDMDDRNFSNVQISSLFNFEIPELRKEYAAYNFQSVTALLDWISTYENITKSGMGGKLLNLKKSGGGEAFARRAGEIYSEIKNARMEGVKFEISKVMYDNCDALDEETAESVTDVYVDMCMDKLCAGESYNVDNIFNAGGHSARQAALLKRHMPDYMERIRAGFDVAGKKNKLMLLNFFADVKHEAGDDTWKEFFGGRREDISVFTEMAAEEIIRGGNVRPFETPESWTEDDLNETVAYIDSSTKDAKLKDICLRYIARRDECEWDKYGVSVTKHTKTRKEQQEDIQRIRRMLQKVGYIPYQRKQYKDIRADVISDMNGSASPLLLSRLLDAVYRWQSSYGNQPQAEKAAQRVRKLMIEMRRTECSCFDYIIPKLALEIIDSPGHYHEIMINADTMPESFWNWFLIGYGKRRRDDDKMLTYMRVYSASKRRISRMSVNKRMRAAFKDVD